MRFTCIADVECFDDRLLALHNVLDQCLIMLLYNLFISARAC